MIFCEYPIENPLFLSYHILSKTVKNETFKYSKRKMTGRAE